MSIRLGIQTNTKSDQMGRYILGCADQEEFYFRRGAKKYLKMSLN